MLHNAYTIIIVLLSEIDKLLQLYVYDGYGALSRYLTIPLGLISTLYIVLLGYATMIGWVQLNIQNLLKSIFKIALIYSAVTSWGFVSEYIVGFINAAIGDLGDAIISASPMKIPAAEGIDGALQVTLIQFTKLSLSIFDTGSWVNFGGWFDGLLVMCFGYLVVALGVFEIILAKVMLAILFVFIPLMVIFCYFKPFQSIFDRYLGAIVGFALLQLFVTAALALALSVAYWWLSLYMGETALQIGHYGIWSVIIIGIVCIGIILKAASLAQNLGGIVSTSAASAMIGGMVGGAMGSLGLGRSLLSTGTSANGFVKSLGGLGSGALGGVYSGTKSVMKDIKSNFYREDSK